MLISLCDAFWAPVIGAKMWFGYNFENWKYILNPENLKKKNVLKLVFINNVFNIFSMLIEELLGALDNSLGKR